MAIIAINQAWRDKSGVPVSAAICSGERITGADLRSRLLLRDFVEAVPTNVSQHLKFRKENFVYQHDVAFMWPNHDVVNAVSPDDRIRVRRARIHSFDFSFPLYVVEAVRPNMPRITHQ